MSGHSYTVPTADLQQRILHIYNHLYANANIKTPSGISGEVGKILHTAMFVEENHPASLLFEDRAQTPAFRFQPARARQMEHGDDVCCAEVAKGLRQNFSSMNALWHLYDADAQLLLSDADLAYACVQLNNVLVSDRNRDVFGDALEVFRGLWSKRAGGQFFTDQKVTSLAMTLLQFDPRKGDDLVDLCAGTGGFLLAGLNHIHKLTENDATNPLLEAELVTLAARSLKGQEIDADVCDVANATLLSRLGSTSRAVVTRGDSLSLPPSPEHNDAGISYDSHLCAATNPPFGTKITIKNENVLRNFDLASTFASGKKASGKLSHRAPDVLFLEQNVRILKPGDGRLAIVVPYQILSGPQMRFVREWLIRHVEILAVVDLPADTFQPHTGTKGALLVVKRRFQALSSIEEAENNKVFFSMPRWIGHDRRGNPVYRRGDDGSPTGEILSDFDDVGLAFSAFQTHEEPSLCHQHSFTVHLNDILIDPDLHMNASFHRPTATSHVAGRQGGAVETTWQSVKLQDVVKRIFYPTRFKRNYVDHHVGAVPFLGGANISQMVVTTDKWLRADDPKLAELRVCAGWILITRSGSTGIVSTVPENWDGFAMSEHVIRIVPDPEKLDPAYLSAFLRTCYAQEKISRGVFGSVIDEITPEFIGELQVPLPASIPGSYDIINKAKRAEDARNVAIKSLLEAVDEFDRHLRGLDLKCKPPTED